MDITITTQTTRVPVTVLHVNGNIDSSTYLVFQEHAEKLIAGGTRYLLVDLSTAPFISSAGLRAIHNIFNQLRAIHQDADDDALRKSMSAGTYKSPYLKVCNLSKEVRDVFELGGFDTYIETYDSIEKAVSSF